MLEVSGSVGDGTGWVPCHGLVRKDGALVGAVPLYWKNHSYGEYIFDWQWAHASRGAGLPYYPKLVSAVPFTPATGRRLLVHPDWDVEVVERELLKGVRQVADDVEAWSVHLLFVTQGEMSRQAGFCDFMPQVTQQFHWTNEGYGDFDDWLSRFRSRTRKEVRRERGFVAKAGVESKVILGQSLEPRHWGAFEAFYRNTVYRKGGHPYLTPEFFALIPEKLAHLVVGIVAEDGDRVVAGALCFRHTDHLYGRYWGSLPEHRDLHFEVCYHRPIELCIERGWQRFEAGAQGQHKLKRGLMPHPTRSLHWLRHPGLARAVQDVLVEQNASVTEFLDHLSAKGPFLRGPEP